METSAFSAKMPVMKMSSSRTKLKRSRGWSLIVKLNLNTRKSSFSSEFFKSICLVGHWFYLQEKIKYIIQNWYQGSRQKYSILPLSTYCWNKTWTTINLLSVRCFKGVKELVTCLKTEFSKVCNFCLNHLIGKNKCEIWKYTLPIVLKMSRQYSGQIKIACCCLW